MKSVVRAAALLYPPAVIVDAERAVRAWSHMFPTSWPVSALILQVAAPSTRTTSSCTVAPESVMRTVRTSSTVRSIGSSVVGRNPIRSALIT